MAVVIGVWFGMNKLASSKCAYLASHANAAAFLAAASEAWRKGLVLLQL
jgi:hypothetical protein